MVRRILLSRGIEVTQGFPSDATAFAAASEDLLLDAALACADEAEFLATLRQSPGASD